MRELTAGMYELIDEIAPGGAGAATRSAIPAVIPWSA